MTFFELRQKIVEESICIMSAHQYMFLDFQTIDCRLKSPSRVHFEATFHLSYSCDSHFKLQMLF